MTTVEVLRDAREKLAKPGVWAKGPGPLPDGKLCAGIAIELTVAGPYFAYRARDVYRLAIGRADIIAWHDAPERTLEEVLAAFDRAIELAEAQ